MLTASEAIERARALHAAGTAGWLPRDAMPAFLDLSAAALEVMEMHVVAGVQCAMCTDSIESHDELCPIPTLRAALAAVTEALGSGKEER